MTLSLTIMLTLGVSVRASDASPSLYREDSMLPVMGPDSRAWVWGKPKPVHHITGDREPKTSSRVRPEEGVLLLTYSGPSDTDGSTGIIVSDMLIPTVWREPHICVNLVQAAIVQMFTEHDDRLRIESLARIFYDMEKVLASSYNLHCLCFVDVVRSMGFTHIGYAAEEPMPKDDAGTAKFCKEIRIQIFATVRIGGAVLPEFHLGILQNLNQARVEDTFPFQFR